MNIVQVHLGRKIPDYLFDQLEQARRFNPSTPIFLLLSKNAEGDRERLRGLATIVRVETIRRCRNHWAFSLGNRLERRRLDGFWLHTSERFFAIESFLAACDLTNVVHLENDVMLYANIEGMKDAFERTCPGIGLTMDSDDRCVPGFVFIRNREAIGALNEFVVTRTMRRAKSDMVALGLYMSEGARNGCSPLPVIPQAYRASNKLKNSLGSRGTRDWFDKYYEVFGGVFDGAALGQYVGGIDKQHNPADTRGYVNETAVYGAKNMGIHWKIEGGLTKPFGMVDDMEFPIFNLHIHSKQLREFASTRSSV